MMLLRLQDRGVDRSRQRFILDIEVRNKIAGRAIYCWDRRLDGFLLEETALTGATSFEDIATTHLDAAYSLARWLTRDAALAEDVVQDSMVRALTYFRGFRGDNPRAWLLQIVRNVALNKLDSRPNPISIDAVENSSGETLVDTLSDGADGPEATLERQQDRKQVSELLKQLPLELRECLILRELEECSYKEIARIIAAPIGTVMSRLWRARKMLIEIAERGEAR